MPACPLSNSPASPPARTAASGPTAGTWLRLGNPIFRFLASLRLALLLLGVLIVAGACGTVYESDFSAEVARACIYEAWWFNLWLLMLCVNLAAVAFSRRPWKSHHTGFLLTHFGIITLLVGAVIGRSGGIEGTVTLFKGRNPTNFIVTDKREIRLITRNHPPSVFPVTIWTNSPSFLRPIRLGTLPNGTEVWATGYAKKLDAVFTPAPAPAGKPAIKLRLSNPMMNQTIEQWVMLGSEDHGALDLGLIDIRFKSGAAAPIPAVSAGQNPQPLEETIFGFANNPDQQVTKVIHGGTTGAKVFLKIDGQNPVVTVRGAGQEWILPARPGASVPLGDTGLSATVESYWPDFRVADSGPTSVSDQPNNPAVLVTVRGTGIVVSDNLASTASPDPHAETNPMNARHRGEIDLSDKGDLTYRLEPDPGRPMAAGVIKLNQPIATNWGAWTLTVVDFLPFAQENTVFRPLPADAPPMVAAMATEGLKLKLVHDGTSDEEWVAMGWSVDYPLPDAPEAAFAYRTRPLPFGLQLANFEVQREEGSDSPAGFKSTLRITDTDGNVTTGSCLMNVPMDYPGGFWRGLTGFTYKISQASWNPDNLNQSSVQILFDPGWSLKWIGSLVICCGIFCLFYLRPAPRYHSPTTRPPSFSPPAEKTETLPPCANKPSPDRAFAA